MTITTCNKRMVPLLVVITALVMLIGVSSVMAAPIKLVQAASIKNGFEYPESIAVAPNGNIYVADRGHDRVQELTPTGAFVLMFGWDVNKTKVLASAPQSERNLCTAVSLDVCQAGVEGTAAGQFALPYSLAVDPSSEAVYVQEVTTGNYRVDKYTAGGAFVWMIGREVDQTTKGNICTAASKNLCGRGLESTTGSTAHGEFKFPNSQGDLLGVGGPEKLLYVGDEQRVQEFDGEGTWKSEISPVAFDTETGCDILVQGCRVKALAVDSVGSVYVNDNAVTLSPSYARIRVFDHEGKENAFEILPKHGGEVNVNGIAIDAEGHLAVTTFESAGSERGPVGLLYETGARLGHLLTEFRLPSASDGITFDKTIGLRAGYLYAAVRGEEVLAYNPLPVTELIPQPTLCAPGVPRETNATLNCTLDGEINPEGVPKTEVWFEWGRSPELGEKTSRQPIKTVNALIPVSAEVGNVRPNEKGFYYRLAAYDENLEAPEGEPPETLTSEKLSFTTPIVPPVIVGMPSVLFVKSASAVMGGELNPENAKTKYFFEYSQGETLSKCPSVLSANCPGVGTTPALESSVYGKIATNLEARGLQAGTVYHYRLAAESENDAKNEKLSSVGAESSFITEPAPRVEAITGPAAAITTNSAIVFGIVNPDGQPAAYTFQLGLYAGALTQYGIVLSGLVEGPESVERSLMLTGLQPGTTYAYKITISSGSGGQSEGQPKTFTTLPLPTVVPVPTLVAMLPVPKISFPPPPRPPVAKCKAKLVRDKHGKCVKAKKKDGKNSRGRAHTKKK